MRASLLPASVPHHSLAKLQCLGWCKDECCAPKHFSKVSLSPHWDSASCHPSFPRLRLCLPWKVVFRPQFPHSQKIVKIQRDEEGNTQEFLEHSEHQ